MTPRWLTLLILLGAAPLAADQPSPATDTLEQAATALGNGDPAAFAATFDPAMPGFAALRAAATELVQHTDAQSTIQFQGESGDSRSRTLQMDWTLRIAEREASKAVTTRQAHVTCRVNLRGGQ
jgi:murein L,D-transpeptidase YcbB/YkuD